MRSVALFASFSFPWREQAACNHTLYCRPITCSRPRVSRTRGEDFFHSSRREESGGWLLQATERSFWMTRGSFQKRTRVREQEMTTHRLNCVCYERPRPRQMAGDECRDRSLLCSGVLSGGRANTHNSFAQTDHLTSLSNDQPALAGRRIAFIRERRNGAVDITPAESL